MSAKLPTVMTPAKPPANDRDYDRPLVLIGTDGVVYVELAGAIVAVFEQYGESHTESQLRPAPAGSPELLTRHEAAGELAELLERIAMSKTARAAVDQVINKYGSRKP